MTAIYITKALFLYSFGFKASLFQYQIGEVYIAVLHIKKMENMHAQLVMEKDI